MSTDAPPPVAELRWHQRCLLAVLAGIMHLWGQTLRFRWGPDVQAIMERPIAPCVIIFWHNRLFAAPLFYRRFFPQRRLATLISASGDGAWPAAFVTQLGIRPVRGSSHRRGAQALRELIAAQHAGFDVAVTPDGSRGPMYDMKAGALAVALKTGAPILLLSFNYGKAWRLGSWDRFFVPYPFSRVEVRIEQVAPQTFDAGTDASENLAARLKDQLMALTQP